MSVHSHDFEEQMQSEEGLPDAWIGEEGQLLIGRITGMTEGWSDQSNSTYPILLIHDEVSDTDKAFHCFHMVVQNRLAVLKPDVGDRIGIKKGPKIPLKNNPSRSVQTYTVKVEGKQEKLDWERYGQRRGRGGPTPAEAAEAAAPVADDDIPF